MLWQKKGPNREWAILHFSNSWVFRQTSLPDSLFKVENPNYPGIPTQPGNPTHETQGHCGGRVFFTSTDQDGNFSVGGLFSVQQATGTNERGIATDGIAAVLSVAGASMISDFFGF